MYSTLPPGVSGLVEVWKDRESEGGIEDCAMCGKGRVGGRLLPWSLEFGCVDQMDCLRSGIRRWGGSAPWMYYLVGGVINIGLLSGKIIDISTMCVCM